MRLATSTGSAPNLPVEPSGSNLEMKPGIAASNVFAALLQVLLPVKPPAEQAAQAQSASSLPFDFTSPTEPASTKVMAKTVAGNLYPGSLAGGLTKHSKPATLAPVVTLTAMAIDPPSVPEPNGSVSKASSLPFDSTLPAQLPSSNLNGETPATAAPVVIDVAPALLRTVSPLMGTQSPPETGVSARARRRDEANQICVLLSVEADPSKQLPAAPAVTLTVLPPVRDSREVEQSGAPASHAGASERPLVIPQKPEAQSAELAFAAKITPKAATQEKAPLAAQPVRHEQPEQPARIVQELPSAPPRQAAVF
ncbi:MAG: hypothetical protein M3Z23_14760, partial [Acidobacteriota bacterium]|nr:hypothetical protein [Acidobacteriota bacterium]